MGEAMESSLAAKGGPVAETDPTSAGAAGEPGSEAEGLRTALAQAEENLRQQREQYLRAAAELDNVRKRAQRDIESAHRYALERFASELLPVRDSLELGVRNGASSDPQSVIAGQEATLKLLERAFEKFSIKQIDPSGQPFDPALHEAVLMQAAPNATPNSVLQVVQSGYELNGRLLRPARVVVATAPAAPAS
jgi:molecular chaperone GrpE